MLGQKMKYEEKYVLMKVFNKLLALVMLALSLVVLSTEAQAAISREETKYFIDEYNHMGYYVDIATVRFDSHRTFNADVYVVRSRDRVMFIHDTRFDIETGSYQYLNSKVYKYEGRQLVGSNEAPTPVQSYVDTPQIRAIVNFVMDWHRRYPNDFYVPPPPPPPPPVQEEPPAPQLAVQAAGA